MLKKCEKAFTISRGGVLVPNHLGNSSVLVSVHIVVFVKVGPPDFEVEGGLAQQGTVVFGYLDKLIQQDPVGVVGGATGARTSTTTRRVTSKVPIRNHDCRRRHWRRRRSKHHPAKNQRHGGWGTRGGVKRTGTTSAVQVIVQGRRQRHFRVREKYGAPGSGGNDPIEKFFRRI